MRHVVARLPLAVIGLVALNVFAFTQELGASDATAFVDAFAVIPYDLTNGIALPPPAPSSPVLTLVTAMFVHGSWLHLGANMLFLAAFGPDVERALGRTRFLATYLACGLAGNLAQVGIDVGSHVPSVGASGAIAGILGTYLILYPLRIGRVVFIAFWAGVQFLHGIGVVSSHVGSERSGGTAYFAHIGGFVAGVVLAEFAHRRRALRR